jgi:hypothetical protein
MDRQSPHPEQMADQFAHLRGADLAPGPPVCDRGDISVCHESFGAKRSRGLDDGLCSFCHQLVENLGWGAGLRTWLMIGAAVHRRAGYTVSGLTVAGFTVVINVRGQRVCWLSWV